MVKNSYCACLIAATALLGVQLPTAAQATTYLTYDVTFTATTGPESGSGSFTIAEPNPGIGGVLTPTALSFNVGGISFGLDSSSLISYYFQGASFVLGSLVYGGQDGADKLLTATLSSNGGYIFTDAAESEAG